MKRKARKLRANTVTKVAQLKSYESITKPAKRMPSKKIYICSPLRGSIENNIRRARVYCRFAFEEGFVPIAPHIYFPQFLDEDNKIERAEKILEELEDKETQKSMDRYKEVTEKITKLKEVLQEIEGN